MTSREREVLWLRCEGKTHSEISGELFIAVPTVKSHIAHIYEKLELDTLTNARRNIELLKYNSAFQALGRVSDQIVSKPEAAHEPDVEAEFPQTSHDEYSLIAVLEDEIVLLEERSRALQALPIYQAPQPQTTQGRLRTRRIMLTLVLLGLIAVVGGFIGTGLTLLVVRRQPAPLAVSSATQNVVTPLSIVPVALQPIVASALPPMTMTSFPISSTLCGETNRITAPTPPLLRPQGVTAFGPANTGGAVLSTGARTLVIDKRGVWTGYFATDRNPVGGVGQFNRTGWINCNLPGEGSSRNVNALAIDQLGQIWVGAEEAGVSVWDGQRWRTYTTRDGLPSNKIFGLTIDKQGNVWAGTWEGVAKFDGQKWTVPYALETHTVFSNHVHAIAFDSIGNIWIGHINKGVSQYRKADGQWVYYTADDGSGIGGNEIRSIVVRSSTDGMAESVWFATADGGVSKFEQGKWTVYRVSDGLPSNSINAVAVDKYKRVWAATTKGVAYFDGEKWVIYDTLPTLSVAFGPDCQNCPYNDEHVWTGTTEIGVTHSRLPYPEEAVDIVSVRFFKPDGSEILQPVIVAPSQKFRPEITVRPRPPYQLTEGHGDMLVHLDENDALRFGAYEHMAVKGTIEPGQPFVFTDYDNLFVAPQLPTGEQEKTFTSTWRVWMYTRLAGPPVRITFVVRKP